MGRADENWYHFLLDTLPRYLFMRKIDEDIPVLVRADIPKTSIALIERMISHRVVLVAPTDVIAIERLHFVAARSTVYDSSPPCGIEWVAFSPNSLSKQRRWLLEDVIIKNDSEAPEKIFLARKAKYRNLLNSDQVGRRLESFGFNTLETGENFFTKQHIYFSKARLIVSPGGAILANILFMKKGSKIIAMRSWRDSKIKLWKKLALACNVEYGEIKGIPTYFGRKYLARQHSNYFIPVGLIRKYLKP
jgi:capsular polysaccharide biosynthesis protein